MNEKRTLLRKYPITYMRVHDRNDNRLVGRVVDLTTEGMRIVSEQPITVAEALQLKMSLPIGMGGTEVAFDARPVWSGPDTNPDFFDTGLRFDSITQNGVNAIERIMRLATFKL